MTWARLHDGMTFHPKIIAAGNEVVGIWARMLAYCNCHLTDGVVSESVARGLVKRYETHRGPLRKLAASGLAELQEDGSWMIHDFLDWNDSRAKVLEKREKEASRKRKQRGACPAGQPTGQDAGLRVPTPTSTPTTTKEYEERDGDKELRLQDLEQLGFSRFGQIGGAVVARLMNLVPIARWEWEGALKTQGKSWAYVATVIEGYRDESSKGPKPPHGGDPDDDGFDESVRALQEELARRRAASG